MTVRVTAILPDPTVARLREMAAASGATVTATLVRAVATQRFLHDSARAGHRILLQDHRTGRLRQLVLAPR